MRISALAVLLAFFSAGRAFAWSLQPEGATFADPPAPSKRSVVAVPLLALPAAVVRSSVAFELAGVRVLTGFAYDPVHARGLLTFEPQNGAPPAQIYIHGLLWNGAKFDLLGRQCEATVFRRLPLLDSWVMLSEKDSSRPLAAVSGRQAKAEALRAAKNISLDGRRFAVLQGPLVVGPAEQGKIDPSQRFVLVLELLDGGKTRLAATLPARPHPVRPPRVTLTISPDGRDLLISPIVPVE